MNNLNKTGIVILIVLIFIFGVISGYNSGYHTGEKKGWNNAMFIVALNPSITNGIFIIDSGDHFQFISSEEFEELNGTFGNQVCYKYR